MALNDSLHCTKVRLILTTLTSGQSNEVKKDSFAMTKSLLCNENALLAGVALHCATR